MTHLDYLKIVRETHPAAFIKQADLYYVQVGAFSSIANANAFLNKVKQDYPSAFIKFA
jgi:cell division septation protein DedD